MSAVAVGALLFAVFLLIVAVMVLQEARTGEPGPPTYVVEEVVPFAYSRLSDDAMERLDVEDVQRILEWEVYYLQGLADRGNGAAGDAPVAGSAKAAAFIQERAAMAGVAYEASDIQEVLAYEVEYLIDIGAVGPPVEEGSER